MGSFFMPSEISTCHFVLIDHSGSYKAYMMKTELIFFFFFFASVGRRSSVLKMKPTPPPALEIMCTKRSRTAVRGTSSKRKVLMDDTMVLHGEYVITDTN